MDTQNPSAPPYAQSRVAADKSRNRHHRSGGGLVHDNTRHTTRFTVIGNHLAQHPELSGLAIGLGAHIQSLPAGAPVDIKTLTARFPEGAIRIAAALRELEAHGYLRRTRERVPGGRIVTRTVSCNQPGRRADEAAPAPIRPAHPDHPTPDHPTPDHPTPDHPTSDHSTPGQSTPAHARPWHLTPGHFTSAHLAPGRSAPGHSRPRAARKPLPAVPHPACPAPGLLQAAAELLVDLRRYDPRLLLSGCDSAHLAPGVAAWLERDVSATSVRHALITDLPPEGLRRPAALLAHRLAEQLPPPPPFRAPAPPQADGPSAVRHPLQTCDGCDRAFRAPEPGRCRDCRASAPAAA
ncbi:helix-turn-helix domain-containing protein [Streptomyces sp. NPDC002685]|uniref:helix-turn-helix domain-containing protein n=1 Tax=Streptomyces sp. NPDC002685 TaxID=3154540 RepID=UPI003327937A